MEATVTSKGQITIPISIRKRLRLKKGSKAFFVIDGTQIKVMNEMEYAFYLADQSLGDTAEKYKNKYNIKSDDDLYKILRNDREDLWE